MKALTSIEDSTIRFSFPKITKLLRKRTEQRLAELIEASRQEAWEQGKPFRTREECEAASKGIAIECLSSITHGGCVEFQRTLRIPDDEKTYPLPPGLGCFPLKHVEDYADKLPRSWQDRGGAMFPMHQSEALWMNFSGRYPVALKIATGKICAVSGEEWQDGLRGKPQNYCVVPGQPWLDGYAVEEGVIRQFVAEPLGEGFTVEEQLTGIAEWGGIQLQVLPLDPNLYWKETLRDQVETSWRAWLAPSPDTLRDTVFGETADYACCLLEAAPCAAGAMGLAAGGRMKQDLYKDSRKPSDYLPCTQNRCFVHLCNSEQWELVTGEAPPHTPPSAKDYSRYGLPWFDYYDEKRQVLPCGKPLKDIKSVKELEKETGKKVLPAEPDQAAPKMVVKYIKD